MYCPFRVALQFQNDLFFFTDLFLRLKLIFCSNGMETMLFLSIVWIVFLRQNNARLPFRLLGSLRELFVFHNSN